MLSNAYFLAKIRFNTAENEPAKNLQTIVNFPNFANPNPKPLKKLCSDLTASQRALRAGDRGDPRPRGLRLRGARRRGPPAAQKAAREGRGEEPAGAALKGQT